ncbi:MAG: YggT family protein [Nitrosomonadaceae bacterium]|nr:YggT family protein [Nitrosomonadaceae bacterium]
MKFLATLIDLLLRAFTLGLVVRVILSWVGAPKTHGVVKFLDKVYEVFLVPLRRIIKPIPLGTAPVTLLDLTPLVLLLVVTWILHPLLLWVFR